MQGLGCRGASDMPAKRWSRRLSRRWDGEPVSQSESASEESRARTGDVAEWPWRQDVDR